MGNYLKKELLELIKQDESIFDFIQEGSFDGIWFWDLENPEEEWMNPRFGEILGYESNDMPRSAHAWKDIINDQDRQAALENFHQHIADATLPCDQEIRYLHKNGSTVWIRCRGLAIRDIEGKAIRMLGAHQNITALKESEEKYRTVAKETAENLNKLKAATNTTTIFLDKELNVLQFTPSEHTARHTRQEVSATLSNITSHFNIESIHEKCNKVIQSYEAIEEEVSCHHGNHWWMRISLYKNMKGDIEGLIITFTDITEKKHLDNQVELLSNVLENASDGYAIVDEKGEFIYVNKAYLRMWGYNSADELIGTSPVSNSLNPEDPIKVIEQLMKIGKAELESVALRKDGSTFDVFLSASKYVDNSGKIFFPTFFKDITQKKQQERELEHHRDNLEKLVDQKSKALVESEQRFRILFDDSPTGIYETDADGNCLMVNKRWQEMAGMTQKEALGNNWINGIYEPDRQEIFKLWKKYADTGQSWSQEYRFCNKEGKISWVYGIAKPLFDENNKIIGYIGNNTDITERKQAQLEVKNQRDMFETVINSVPSRIFWKDKKGVYLGCNPNFAMDAGMKSINDVIGKKDESFIWGDDAEKYRADDREVMESGIPKLNYEEPFIGKDGNKFIWQTNKMPLRNNNGEIIGIIAISENITEEKKVADEIIKSQKRYQSLFDNSPTPLWDEDFSEVKKFVDKLKRRNIKDFREYFKRNPDKVAECSKLIKIVDVNQAAVKLHEANSKEELYQGLSIIFTEKSYEAFVEELIAIAEGRHEIVFEGTLKTIHGRELEILLKWQVVPGYEDTLEKVYISSSDITALKQAEEKIKDSEAKFRLIAENSVDFIWQMDLRLNFTYASPAIYGLTGHTAEEWLGSNLANHCSRKELFKMARQAFGAIRNYKKIQSVLFESKIYKKDGEEIPVEIIGKLIFNKKGLPIALQGSTRDISERKKASQILRQSEERYRHIFETAANLITAVDKDGIIVDCNNRLKEILGYEKDKIVGQSITSLLHPDHHDKIFTSLNKIIEEGHDYNQTYKMMRHDGRIIDVNINASAIDNNGVFERTICIIEDITEQLQIQQELLYAKEKAEESNRLKSEFLHNMSHEIRTPMNGIMGFSNLLSEQESSNDNIKNYTSIIHNCSNQLLRIIDDILEISILETKQQKFANNNFHINDFIMEQFAIFDLKAKERKLPFYVKKGLPNDDCIINSDKSKLNKIVSNLLENAFKFTSEGYIELGYYIEDKYLVLYVQDTGLGISEANVDRIFKRFSQESHDIAESHGGLGLGLAIAKENAQLLGGDITVKTQKGKGSIFYVRLPYIANADKKFNHKKQQEQEEATAKKVEHQILIAEDEEINYLYLETVLNSIEKIKCKLIHAKNGKEAVEICLREQNLSLVLMDIKMPIMNGFEATEKIKTIYPKLPIIAQTAYSTEAEKDLAIKHGCDDFISKPIQKQNLFRLIDKYLSFS